MKTLAFLFLLMIVSALSSGSVLLVNQAAAAAAGERVGERPEFEYRSARRITPTEAKDHSIDKRSLPAGPTSEAEAKRLKLILLLMMSLGRHGTPAH